MLFFFLLCAALVMQLWMSEASLHHSISAACEYSGNLYYYYHFITSEYNISCFLLSLSGFACPRGTG